MKSTKLGSLAVLQFYSLFFVLNLSCEPPTKAETTGKIEGITYNATSSQPLNGVTITTEPITSSKITDSNGSFKIEGVEPGDYTLQAAKLEFQTNSTTINVIAGETSTADLQLVPLIPELAISATLLNFGITSTNLTFTIRNSGIGVLTWNVISAEEWISVNPSNGTVENESDVVTVTVNRNGKIPGNYYGRATISSNYNSTILDIMMIVQDPDSPQLSTYPLSLNFGAFESELEFFISNTGTNNLTWTISDNKPWISTGSTTGTNDSTISVSVDRRDLTVGNYGGIIDVYSNAGHNQVEVFMDVSIYNPPTPVTLSEPGNITSSSMDLTWSRNYDEDFNAYQVYYDTTEDVTEQSFLSITISDNNINTHTVTELNSGTTYYFKVYVKDNMDYSAGSNTVSGTTLTIDGNWYLVENIQDVSYFNDVWFVTANNGYAVGEDSDYNGVVYHSNGDSWVRESYTFSNELIGVRFNDANDGFVWSREKIYHFNGVTWSMLTTLPLTNSDSVFPLLSDNIWIVASGLYHWDGSVMSDINIGITPFVVNFINQEDGWVLGYSGQLYHYNGMGWALHSSGIDLVYYADSYNTLAFLNTTEGWLSTPRPKLYHFNGTAWSSQQPFTTYGNDVTSIFPLSHSNVWAVTKRGNIYHYDGSSWDSESSPTSEYLYGLFMVSDSDGWAVGRNGVILRYQ